jgi:restriction system protein
LAQKAERAAHFAASLHEAENQTDELAKRVDELDTLLSDHLKKHFKLKFESLKSSPKLPPFAAQGSDIPSSDPELKLPPALSFIAALIPALKRRHDAAVAAAMLKHDAERAEHAENEAKRVAKLEELRISHKAECDRLIAANDASNKEIDELREDYGKMVPDAVNQYFELVFDNDRLPEDFPLADRVAYVADSKQLVVEREMPDFDVVPTIASFRYVKSSDKLESKDRPLSQRKLIYEGLLARFALATAYVVYDADDSKVVDILALSLFVDTIDRKTGQAIRPCILSLRVARDTFSGLDLHRVDPVACLKSLGARVSPSPHELVPVPPVVNFNMVDPRFIGSRDVLGGLDQRPNLAELTPSDFESLITNLFEKMGLETRQTRASRDGGVDCVAWENRGILSGKVVIQAKRYRHTVGVSAVRDLYGTMMNEGASKGILITTSGYGKSAFTFAQDKPMTLITGQQLLYLLKENANIEAKIEFPDQWVDPIPDATDEPGESPNPGSHGGQPIESSTAPNDGLSR